MNKSQYEKHAMALYEFCEYPAVRYNIFYTLLDVPYEDERLTELRKEFLKSDIVEEMYAYQEANGLWDWGPQTNDPWGYFGYFSCNRHYQHNRVVDGTMEILKFLKKYLDNNE